MAKAMFVYADVLEQKNTSIYRIFTPAKWLQKAGHEIEVVPVSQIPFGRVPEVCLVEREINSDFKGDIVSALRKSGAKRVIATFDDSYEHIPKSLPAWHFWNRDDKKNIALFREGLGRCDLAIVPSRKLAEDARSFVDTRIVQNYLDDDLWGSVSRHKSGDRVVIGYGGSLGHTESWRNSPASKAMKLVMEKFSNVVFRVYGSAVSNVITSEGIEHSGHSDVSFDRWPHEVGKFDIGLAPLRGVYDSYRSSLKLIEYGCAMAAPVYSASDPYEDFNGQNACSTWRDWYDAIVALVEDETHRTAVARHYKKIADNYMASKCVFTYERILWDN